MIVKGMIEPILIVIGFIIFWIWLYCDTKKGQIIQEEIEKKNKEYWENQDWEYLYKLKKTNPDLHYLKVSNLPVWGLIAYAEFQVKKYEED